MNILILNIKQMEEKLIKIAREQESFLLRLRDSLISRNRDYENNPSWQHERAKLIGMIAILDVLEIDWEEFRWIFY